MSFNGLLRQFRVLIRHIPPSLGQVGLSRRIGRCRDLALRKLFQGRIRTPGQMWQPRTPLTFGKAHVFPDGQAAGRIVWIGLQPGNCGTNLRELGTRLADGGDVRLYGGQESPVA